MSHALLLAAESSTEAAVSSPATMTWWVVGIAGIVGLLLLDLLVLHRDAHVVDTAEATRWSIIWITLGVAFAGVIWAFYPGGESAVAAGEYLSGYLIEKSLSVDNLFVFVLVFSYFNVPDKYQHRVLFYGILGALVFRGIFIGVGAVLLERFAWIAYVFGAFLVYTGIKLATGEEVEVHPQDNPVLKLVRRFVPVTDDYDGQKLFTRIDGVRYATPLFAVLVVIETTDVIFAVDSIPAIFGVTRDPFIVFTSNAFALLGLRALYFLLASAVRRFRYLGAGVAMVLVLVGAKLIAEEAISGFHPPAWVPLALIGLILGGAIWLSLRAEHHDHDAAALDPTPDDTTPEELDTTAGH